MQRITLTNILTFGLLHLVLLVTSLWSSCPLIYLLHFLLIPEPPSCNESFPDPLPRAVHSFHVLRYLGPGPEAALCHVLTNISLLNLPMHSASVLIKASQPTLLSNSNCLKQHRTKLPSFHDITNDPVLYTQPLRFCCSTCFCHTHVYGQTKSGQSALFHNWAEIIVPPGVQIHHTFGPFLIFRVRTASSFPGIFSQTYFSDELHCLLGTRIRSLPEGNLFLALSL